jgi:beta-galactosidase/beta-glucuronidase
MIMTLPRPEYPRPQFERDCWMNLNGQWDFRFDDQNKGILEKWFTKPIFDRKITVPYTYQCEMSGVNIQDFHDIVWYSRSFHLTDEFKGKRILLHFGAVDYEADVWLNGQHMITHEGGHVPFSVDITDYILKDNLLVVRAQDPTTDLQLPRGKQYWKRTSESIFYTRTTGIWQTVWLEGVSDIYLKKVWLTPDVDSKMIEIEYEVKANELNKPNTVNVDNVQLSIEIYLSGKLMVKDAAQVINGRGKKSYWLDQEIPVHWNLQESMFWTPEHPVLFDVVFTLSREGNAIDQVKSYFGLRKVSVQFGKFMLNNKPYYQKMLLDQGYWEQSLLTAPTDEDFVLDIKMSKEMGFNGVRKHQKVEDPRYLYWADKLGFIVWGEAANAYAYSKKYVNRFVHEWMQIIERDYNHPCIVAWTPLNESWGVDAIMNKKDQQAHSASLYWLTKSLDQTRLVISNDGWDHTKSDLLTIHDYESHKAVLKERYSTIESTVNSRPAKRGMYAEGWEYEGQPVILSEIGGISYKKGDWSGWGYSSAFTDEEYIQAYYNVVSAMLESPIIQGFVFTQITDVEQEINGVMTYGRKPKVDPAIIRSINEGRWVPKK